MTTADTIRIIVCRHGEPPQIEEIEPGLAAMQKLVGGYVQRVPLADGVAIWCNEDGALTMPPSRIVQIDGQDVAIHGDFLLVADDGEGQIVSFTEDEAETWLARAAEWPTAGDA